MSCFCEKKEGIKKISELKRKSSNFEGMKKSLIPSHKIGSIGSIGLTMLLKFLLLFLPKIFLVSMGLSF